MKPILVQDQVKLGPRRCLQLALSGMGYRMFRSMITVSILALAVAFLVHMLSYSLLSDQVVVAAHQELEPARRLARWVGRLAAPDGEARIVAGLAAGPDATVAEYAGWAGLSPAELAQARQDAAALADLDRYFTRITPAAAAVVTGGRDALAVARGLSDPTEMTLFLGRLEQLNLPIPLGEESALRALVSERLPRLTAVLGRVESGQRRAIESFRSAPGGSALEFLARSADEFARVVASAGFSVGPSDPADLGPLARDYLDLQQLAAMIESREVKSVVARRLGRPVALVNQDAVLDWLSSRSRAEWLTQAIQKASGVDPGQKGLGSERVLALADLVRREARLRAAVADQPIDAAGPLVARGGVFDLPAATLYLIALSFLVCVVGVANAMLMSVTERFTEIATMKCLGAMDTFVMGMFVFEAGVQGLFGGIVGVVLGLLLALARGYVEFGGLVGGALGSFPQLLLGGLASLIAGIVLAVVAAVWPSWVASRLAPMEAMRVE